jgi:hypothetical protein
VDKAARETRCSSPGTDGDGGYADGGGIFDGIGEIKLVFAVITNNQANAGAGGDGGDNGADDAVRRQANAGKRKRRRHRACGRKDPGESFNDQRQLCHSEQRRRGGDSSGATGETAATAATRSAAESTSAWELCGMVWTVVNNNSATAGNGRRWRQRFDDRQPMASRAMRWAAESYRGPSRRCRARNRPVSGNTVTCRHRRHSGGAEHLSVAEGTVGKYVFSQLRSTAPLVALWIFFDICLCQWHPSYGELLRRHR